MWLEEGKAFLEASHGNTAYPVGSLPFCYFCSLGGDEKDTIVSRAYTRIKKTVRMKYHVHEPVREGLTIDSRNSPSER